MSLSLCMIVKNEESNLPRCLESIKDIVDEMIIIDTGSTDSTVQIARKYGARVYNFPWNDNFSDARNFSLKYASCDWILLMDADDELDRNSRQQVLDLIKADNADAYFFETISYIGDTPGLDVMKNLNMRLMKNGKGYFFSNPIHEQIYTNIKAINPHAKILTEDIKVYHYGYLNKNITAQNKRERNISILEKELEQYPNYGFALFNLGNEYFAMSDNIKALEYYQKSYSSFDPDQGFSSKLVLKLVNCLMHLGRYTEALSAIDEGLGHYPEFTDLVYMKALINNSIGNHLLAVKYFNRCLEMGESSSYFNVIIGTGTYRSYYILGEIYYNSEDYTSAENCLTKALESNPEFTPALSKLIHAICRQQPGRKVLKERLESFRHYGGDKYDTLVSDILIQQKCYDLALDYMQRYEKLYGSSSQMLYYKGLCKLMLKKYKSAYGLMGAAKKDPEYLVRATCTQVLCKILDNDLLHASKLITSDSMDANDPIFKVYSSFLHLMETGETWVLSDNEKESATFTVIILDLLKILLIIHEFTIFEKALNLLNSINDKTVLLRLAKLYYSEKCHGLAAQEFVRSINLFNIMDPEGASMYYSLKCLGY